MKYCALPLILLPAACAKDDRAREEACARLDAVYSVESAIPAAPMPAPARPEPRDLSDRSKLAICVYHFNVQYVAGGLKGFPDGTIVPKFDLDELQVEDRIIREGLEPVLDLYLAHPDFAADLELQAYMVEVIAQRHPDVLDKMRELALRGQVDFDSFHYSDQLYVAYPERDLTISLELTRQVFDRVGLPLGRSIFSQEGQFARGQMAIAQQLGYEVSVLPKNLFTYQMGEDAANTAVFYEDPAVRDHSVLLGARSWSAPGFDLAWTFMDDGEVAFSKADLNPYFGTDYEVDPERLAEHVAGLENLAAQGFVHATIAEAARAMKKRGIVPAPLPNVLDGTWQPRDTNNVFRWMGGAGLFRTYESDSDTLATIWRARTKVELVERALAGNRSPQLARGIAAAWREVLLAEVSDSTGWNPFRTEIAYSRSHSAAAEAIADDVLACAGRGASPATSPPPSCTVTSTKTLADLGVEIRSARAVEHRLLECAGSGSIYQLEVSVPKLVEEEQLLDQTDQESAERSLEMRFARTGDEVSLAPAFEGAVRSYRLDAFHFESIGVALPIGLIGLAGLGDDRWVVQDMATGRVAVLITREGEDRDVLRFRDDTVSRAASSVRRWYLLEGVGAQGALSIAERINRPSPVPN